MTIKELIMENDNFAHSEEAFEIYKESAELNVLNAWIECQEHKAFDSSSVFTENDDNALSAAKEKASAKEEALHKKIWDKIKNTAKKVWSAIRKIIDKILRTFGVMRMPALSKEQKEALLNGEEIFPVKHTMDQLMGDYKRIPNITEDSFTALGDRGTRKIANVLAGKDASKVQIMAATQVAYFLTGQKDLIAPTIIASMEMINGKGIVTIARDGLVLNRILMNPPEGGAKKVVDDRKAYSAYTPKNLENAQSVINTSIEAMQHIANTINGLPGQSAPGLNLVIEILNRDLKIATAMAVIQGYLKSFGDKVAADQKSGESKSS